MDDQRIDFDRIGFQATQDWNDAREASRILHKLGRHRALADRLHDLAYRNLRRAQEDADLRDSVARRLGIQDSEGKEKAEP